MAKCSRCGAEESLAVPFIGGVCDRCLRRESQASRQANEMVSTKTPAAPSPSWGISMTDVFSLISVALDTLGMMIGLFVFRIGWSMDTTVSAGTSYAGDRIYNTGLLQTQLLTVITGLVFFAVGAICLAIQTTAMRNNQRPAT